MPSGDGEASQSGDSSNSAGSDSLGSGLGLGTAGLGLGTAGLGFGAGLGYSGDTLGQGQSLGTGLSNAAGQGYGDAASVGGLGQGLLGGGSGATGGIGDGIGLGLTGLNGFGLGLSGPQSSSATAAIAAREGVPPGLLDGLLAIGLPLGAAISAISKAATGQSLGEMAAGWMNSRDTPSFGDIGTGAGYGGSIQGDGGGSQGGMLTGAATTPQAILAANTPMSNNASVNSVGLFNSPMSQSQPEYISQAIPVTPMSFYERVYGKQPSNSVVSGLFSSFL